MPDTSDKSLGIDVQREGPGAIITLRGSVTMDETGKLVQTLEELTGAQTAVIVLNLTELDFICSTGLGAIIRGHLKTRSYDGGIRLVNPQPSVKALLETTRLTELFPLFPTVEAALSS